MVLGRKKMHNPIKRKKATTPCEIKLVLKNPQDLVLLF